MGLDSFETDGPRTYSNGSKQKKLNNTIADEFEDEWGVGMMEAKDDPDFFRQRFEEGKSVEDICKMFHWLPTSVVSVLSEFVDDGELDPQVVPEVDEERYNDKPIAFYLKQTQSNQSVTKMGRDRNEDDKEDTSSSKSGLDAFRT